MTRHWQNYSKVEVCGSDRCVSAGNSGASARWRHAAPARAVDHEQSECGGLKADGGKRNNITVFIWSQRSTSSSHGRVLCLMEIKASAQYMKLILHVFFFIRRKQRHGYTHAHDRLSKQTRRRRRGGGGEGGGQQKAAAAPPEPGQKTRTQRLLVPVYSEPKPG